MENITWGTWCLHNIVSFVNKHEGMGELPELIRLLEAMGWRHSLTTYRQKRKHIYEVLRQARRDGKSTIRIEGELLVV